MHSRAFLQLDPEPIFPNFSFLQRSRTLRKQFLSRVGAMEPRGFRKLGTVHKRLDSATLITTTNLKISNRLWESQQQMKQQNQLRRCNTGISGSWHCCVPYCEAVYWSGLDGSVYFPWSGLLSEIRLDPDTVRIKVTLDPNTDVNKIKHKSGSIH